MIRNWKRLRYKYTYSYSHVPFRIVPKRFFGTEMCGKVLIFENLNEKSNDDVKNILKKKSFEIRTVSLVITVIDVPGVSLQSIKKVASRACCGCGFDDRSLRSKNDSERNSVYFGSFSEFETSRIRKKNSWHTICLNIVKILYACNKLSDFKYENRTKRIRRPSHNDCFAIFSAVFVRALQKTYAQKLDTIRYRKMVLHV